MTELDEFGRLWVVPGELAEGLVQSDQVVGPRFGDDLDLIEIDPV
jgi:hypothetical protein